MFEMDNDYEFEDEELLTPGKNIFTVVEKGGKPQLTKAMWGIHPIWSDKKSLLIFNSRAESISEKPMFAKLLKAGRCVIPATGYFEWKKIDEKHKQPYFFTLKNQDLFFFAGLYQSGENPSCTIITTSPNPKAMEVHNRMPVILTKNAITNWLAPAEADLSLLKAFNEDLMDIKPLN